MRRPTPDAAPVRGAFVARWSYAHRGLHRPGGPAENSLPAFAAAVADGQGIECDIRLSRDGVPFVFHDATLDRMTGRQGAFNSLDSGEIAALHLPDGSAIPRLAAMLELVAGRVPLLIEVKVDAGTPAAPLARTVSAEMAGYAGPWAVISFHPDIGRWFSRHAPGVVRGHTISEARQPGRWGAVKRRLAIGHARPDFLAYDVRDLPSPTAAAARARGLPIVAWTVRTGDERRRAALHADAIMFENEAGG